MPTLDRTTKITAAEARPSVIGTSLTTPVEHHEGRSTRVKESSGRLVHRGDDPRRPSYHRLASFKVAVKLLHAVYVMLKHRQPYTRNRNLNSLGVGRPSPIAERHFGLRR